MTRIFILLVLSATFFLVPNAFVQASSIPSNVKTFLGSNKFVQSAGITNQSSNRSAGLTKSENITLINPLGAGTNLSVLVADILQLIVRAGTIVVILMLVYIGFLFVTAQGEPAKIQQARSALLWTIVGALLLLGAEAIAQGISATVGALSTGN